MSEMLNDLLLELSAFPGRERDLRSVYRWHNWTPMYYRPHLFSHGKKIARMILHVAPLLEKKLGSTFDIKRALLLALVHDDPEILTGDYQAGDKDKMTKEQLDAIDAEEREAIKELVQRYPKMVGGYDYEDLQLDVQDARSDEGHVMKFFDLLDGYGEGIHELYAGNLRFVTPITNKYGLIPLFDELNLRRRKGMMEKCPVLEALKDSHTFFRRDEPLVWKPIVQDRQPYTKESVREKVGYMQYDLWKEIILGSGDMEDIESLYTQREFKI